MRVSRNLWILPGLVFIVMCFAWAAPAQTVQRENPGVTVREDNLPDPLTTRKLELKERALEAKLNGKAFGRTYQVARGQYVELARDGEGAVWTVLGEFSDFPHNSIAEPNRVVNNTTIWVPDFSRAYYLKLLFDDSRGANSMRNFYIEQSSNRYTVFGDVTDWIPVPHDHVYYDDNPDSNVWFFIQDTINGWYDAQIAAGKTPEQINEYLSQFDKWDRYDYDSDGDVDEPDGYIDTFQSVHSGEGEEAGGGALGAEAIWSHSWYAHSELRGIAGPSFNLMGGVRIGQSDYWVGKYTIQPENGGVGVFTHEFGHDLGLPDLYDTAGGQNGTGFWTVMSSGSWMDDGKNTIGNKSSHMGAWEKFQLGWLNYEVAVAGAKSVHKLGPMESTTKQAQGLFVVLPKKPVSSQVGTPYAGSYFYYSGSGDRLNNFMYKAFSLGPGSTLTAKVRYNIELDWDYAYLVVSTDGGATWQGLQTNLSTTTNPHNQNFGYGITGISSGWVDLTADLPAGNVLLGFRYWTDTNTGGFGFMIDDINITGLPTDGAETDAGWTYAPTPGFHASNGTEITYFNHYYVAEYRQYKGYDTTLKVGPYYFGYLNDPSLQDYVDHFPYQDGLLINYWDTTQRNNQTIRHPGAGLVLPVDAHFTALRRVDGLVWSNRIQTYDSTFTLTPTDEVTLHVNSIPSFIPSLPAAPMFDDRTLYWDPANPQGSVKNPNTGTQISIQSISSLGGFMQVEVRPVK